MKKTTHTHTRQLKREKERETLLNKKINQVNGRAVNYLGEKKRLREREEVVG